jgi:hypothetical protein
MYILISEIIIYFVSNDLVSNIFNLYGYTTLNTSKTWREFKRDQNNRGFQATSDKAN